MGNGADPDAVGVPQLVATVPLGRDQRSALGRADEAVARPEHDRAADDSLPIGEAAPVEDVAGRGVRPLRPGQAEHRCQEPWWTLYELSQVTLPWGLAVLMRVARPSRRVVRPNSYSDVVERAASSATEAKCGRRP